MSINPDPDSPFASPPGWFSGDTQMSELHLHSCLYRVHRKDSEKGVRLPKHQGEECTIDNRVTRVAWLNRSTILYAGNDKWCLDPRVVLLSNTQTQYSIEIQNVDVYDEGPYTCSVQTDNHPKTSRVHLIVQVSPKIVEISSDISINEGNNISLTCIATGRPEPTVTWRHISPKGGMWDLSSLTRNQICTSCNGRTVVLFSHLSPCALEQYLIHVSINLTHSLWIAFVSALLSSPYILSYFFAALPT
ncbi:hypothetical protein MJG53_016764, partial [Ovis ammon polii x Ovis aries]